MKLNCGLTFNERYEQKTNWHKWFAWYPVRIASGDCRWLEHVERKVDYLWGDVDKINYRELQ